MATTEDVIMTDYEEEPFPFLDLPLELRHIIYDKYNEREDGHEHVMRDWFDKAEGLIPSAGDEIDNSDSEDEIPEEDGEEEDDDDDEEEEDTDAASHPSANMVSGTLESASTTTTRARPQTKYRHTIGMFELSACPPPPNILLVNKQIKDEAIRHFYETANLTIHATQSFCHYTFFEETLDLLVNKPFSPLESIRKCTLRFVWDSELLRGSDMDSGIHSFYEEMLSIRANKVAETLKKAPNLKEIKIEWHDTVKSVDSMSLAQLTLAPIIENEKGIDASTRYFWMEPGHVPDVNSIQGKMKVGLRKAFDSGHHFC
ncbi:hypothetical protein NA57DRAFT_78826 [Rhizodiscina lignyota]|uniref:Uncharacterized protein n=1 Tax=Rhizodiscina lignyota TaxID=1504668 RepID=A0A9P4M2V4_9PEZI|nr:hypothetical protein NA57DRAFT_78826 [Rhizodiscina lignyota]